MRKPILRFLCGLLAGVALAGCTPPPPRVSPPPSAAPERPLWVTQCGGAFPDESGRAFYGVGKASKALYPDVYLLRLTATEHARREVAAQLRAYVGAVVREYAEAAFAPADPAATRSLTSATQKSTVDAALGDSELRDQWTHPASGDLYCLVRVNLDAVAVQIRTKIAEVEKGRLRLDADQAHQELDRIIEKHRRVVPGR